jgi:glycerol kinase
LEARLPDLVVSIDAGTTGIKVLVLAPSGSEKGRAYAEFAQSYPKPGWVEHDASEIWEKTEEVLAAALADAGVSPPDVAAIGITNQRETTVLWDRSSGEPAAPAIVWQDRRTAEICEKLKADGLEGEIKERTGLVLDPYFSGTKVMWMLDQDPALRKRADEGSLAFGTIDSWLIYKLTAGEVHVTEPGNASRTLLYSLAERRWDEWILDKLDIPPGLLPEISPSSGRFGETAAGVIGDKGVPVSGVAGDQQAALFGQACFEGGMAKNTYGTGSFVLMNTGGELNRSEHGLLTSAGWDIGGDCTYVLEGSIFVTGAAIQWMRDGLEVISEAAETGPLAESVEDSGGTYLVPAFTGLGAPHWDPYARGAYLGITRGTTRAHLARAVVDAMAFQTRDVVEAMNSDAGRPIEELRVDGGASVMDVLCQVQADQLGVVVTRPANLETTALGAAYLAGIAEGVWTMDDISAAWKAEATFEPSADRSSADEAYDTWKRAIDRSRSWIEH